MNEMLTTRTESERLYEKISGLITFRKAAITQSVNTAMIFLTGRLGKPSAVISWTMQKRIMGRALPGHLFSG